jgi:cytochrome c553
LPSFRRTLQRKNMMAADYRHIGGLENRLGRHYTRFCHFGPPRPLPLNDLPDENPGTAGRIGEVRLKPRAVIKVVETATMPKTRVAGWFLAVLPGAETEPIAGRIIEVPEDLERFEMRDSRSRFIAYVPPGSVDQGRQLATTGGNGKSAPCTICHGPELNGVGPIPGLAGRSPSNLVRQLYDFQHGTRAGPWSPLMAPNVINLTVDDVVALAAYAASLPP